MPKQIQPPSYIREEVVQVSWRIPIELVRVIRAECRATGARPAAVVAERLRESFERIPTLATD